MELIEFTASEEQFRITEIAMKTWITEGQRDDLRVIFMLPQPASKIKMLTGLEPLNILNGRGSAWVEYFIIPELAGTKEKVPLLAIQTPNDRWLAGHGLFFRKVEVAG